MFLLARSSESDEQQEKDGFAVTFSDGRTSIFSSSVSTFQARSVHLNERKTLAELVDISREPSEVWFVAPAIYVTNSAPTGPRNEQQERDTNPQRDQAVPFLFTGNDFGILRTQRFASGECADADADCSSENNLRPKILDYDDKARHHTAGVTSILPLPVPLVDGSPLLLTGSYDEFVRVYHATQRGNVLAEKQLGGGVWRLQLVKDETEHNPASSRGYSTARRFLVLASCMHAGTRIIRVTSWRQSSHFTHRPSVRMVFSPELSSSVDSRLNQAMKV